MEVYIKNNPQWTDYESIINLGNQFEIDKQIVQEVQKALDGYHHDGEREFYYEANDNELLQIYCDDPNGDDTINWSVGSVDKHHSGKLEVHLHC